MKITINTAEMLGDETTIRDEVIGQVSEALQAAIYRDANDLIKETLRRELAAVVKSKVEELVAQHLDTEFTEVGEYGSKGRTITLRNKIAEIVKSQCVFKEQRSGYSSEQNAFTNSVLNVVADEVKKFQKEFNSQVNAILVKSCLDEATKKLKAACGIV